MYRYDKKECGFYEVYYALSRKTMPKTSFKDA